MHPDLASVAQLTQVVARDEFIIAGQRYSCPTGPDASPVQRLGMLLYRHCYIRPYAAPHPIVDRLAERDFRASLIRAGSGRRSWQPGWHAERPAQDGRTVVSRYGIRFWAAAEDARAEPGRVGERGCSVRIPGQLLHLLPGFHLVAGDTSPDDGPMVRLYWHLTPAAAPRFVDLAARFLDDASVPFQLKVLSSPNAYLRADAGVVYLNQRHYDRARTSLTHLHNSMIEDLRTEVPMFTRRLAPGLAVAEDPEDGPSFGRHRCRIIAAALLAAHRRPQLGPEGAISEAFRSRRLDPDRPHLQPGSTDSYGLSFGRRAGGAVSGGYLDAAVSIGRALCAEAHWDRLGRHCNWIGRSNPPQGFRPNRAPVRFTALGADVYGGLSGVALFLAELFGLTADEQFRLTAAAAVRCAARQLERRASSEASLPLGFYTGVTGVAAAAHRVTQLTGEAEAGAGIAGILADATATPRPSEADDLISGRAGAILALLFLDAWPSSRSRAITLGEELCRSPTLAHGLAAIGPGRAERQLSSGLSHGAAGIGLALLALYDATGREDFLAAGRRAFAYQDSLFDERQGNWLAFAPVANRADPTPTLAMAWCHGAPGIALARLRASRLDPARAADYLAPVRRALESIRDALARRRPVDAIDATPCHGTTGLIETLWSAHLVLGEPEWRRAAIRAADDLVRARTPLPSGLASGGPNPSLLVGSAGVGYELLRLHDPNAVPQLLLGPCRPEGATARSPMS